MIRKIIKYFSITILFIIILLVGTCGVTSIVDYKEYRFLGGEAYLINKEQPDSKLHAYIPIFGTHHRNIGIPFINNSVTYKDPFYYYFTIWGDFDNIESLEANFIHNKINKIKIPISIKRLNSNRAESNTWKTKFYFPYQERIILPITWDNTDNLSAEVDFVGVKNGIKKKYKLREEYKKDAVIKNNTNLYLDAMMGI